MYAAEAGLLILPPARAVLRFSVRQVQELPVKSKAKAARTRYFHYMVLRYEDTVYLRKRTDKDIALTETDSPNLPPTDYQVDKVEDLGGKLELCSMATCTGC